jgi:hypothetical protein
MKSSGNGGDVDNTVCYFLVHGFSFEVVPGGKGRFYTWAELSRRVAAPT